jgi:hypothetical protein
MTILLHSLGDYRILTIKRCLNIYKKYDHGTNKQTKIYHFGSERGHNS